MFDMLLDLRFNLIADTPPPPNRTLTHVHTPARARKRAQHAPYLSSLLTFPPSLLTNKSNFHSICTVKIKRNEALKRID
jgi:hypothetical protein